MIGLSEIAEKSTVSWLYALGESINRPYSNFSEGSGPDEGSAYITAFYFTLTSMTTVGFGNVAANTNSEKVFAVITMLIGGKFSKKKTKRNLEFKKLMNCFRKVQQNSLWSVFQFFEAVKQPLKKDYS